MSLSRNKGAMILVEIAHSKRVEINKLDKGSLLPHLPILHSKGASAPVIVTRPVTIHSKEHASFFVPFAFEQSVIHLLFAPLQLQFAKSALRFLKRWEIKHTPYTYY